MIEKYVDAEELKRLLSTLVIIVGCIIIAGLFASIVVPGLRNANRPATPTAVAPVIGESGWLDPAEFPPQKGAIIPPVDPKTLIESTPELINRGKNLFETNCSPCHGQTGHGDGPAAGIMNPRPQNFTSPEGWVNGYDIPGMYKTVTAGIKGTSMAAFDYLRKQDRMALVHYVHSLGTFARKPGDPQAMEALSKELAAPGAKTSNKIPVSMAMARLAEEFKNPAPISIKPEEQGPGVDLLRRTIVSRSRAALLLAGSNFWRLSPRELAVAVLPDVPGNGFSTGVALLSPDEWKLLHQELLSRTKTQ
jgi:mono/diheme cytochrome c family protein